MKQNPVRWITFGKKLLPLTQVQKDAKLQILIFMGVPFKTVGDMSAHAKLPANFSFSSLFMTLELFCIFVSYVSSFLPGV